MSDPKVSVIIPVKNRLNLLYQTLESIFKQTHQAYEVLLVDDHSSEDFGDILDHYKGRVKYIISEGFGPGAARNTGLKHASGRYIQFLDSDDVITRNKFSSQLKELKRTGAGSVYCPHVHVSWDDADHQWVQKDVILQYKKIPDCLDLHKCMVRGFFTIIPGFLFDRVFLDELGPWREDCVAYEDWDYLWRIAELCPSPPHTNECCYFYRVHGTQTTGADFNDIERDRQKIEVFRNIWDKHISADLKLGQTGRNFFKAQIYSTMLKNQNRDLDPELFHSLSTLPVILSAAYLRIESRVNRMLTGTNWQLMHGVCKDPLNFENYRKLL